MSSSALLDSLIDSLQVMPGVGPVSATRIAYYLLDHKRSEGIRLSEILKKSLTDISLCPVCHNYTDEKDCLCDMCKSIKRQSQGLLCIVESPSDVAAIESSGSYSGSYFVLHGHLSPIDGIGAKELGLDDLKKRFEKGDLNEVILALGATVEGEVTSSYIASMASSFKIAVSKIATGVPMGGELGSVDGNTLAVSLNRRVKV